MQHAGVLPEDAPDPQLRLIEQLAALPIPLLGFVPQPHLEDWGAFGLQSSTSNGVMDSMSASIGYTLWRNPHHHDDPLNLGELDDSTRESLDTVPPWPRPRWLVDQVRRMRYPTLWEAVRTSWSSTERRAWFRPEAALVEHVNHILANRFRVEVRPDGLGPVPSVDARSIERSIPVEVDGIQLDGLRIDTDPHVFGVAAELPSGGLLTSVIERDALPFVTVAFAQRAVASASPTR